MLVWKEKDVDKEKLMTYEFVCVPWWWFSINASIWKASLFWKWGHWYVCQSVCTSIYMGLFINYVVSAGGEEGNPKYDLIDRLNLVKKTTRGGGQKSSILRRHSLWTAPMYLVHDDDACKLGWKINAGTDCEKTRHVYLQLRLELPE